MHFRIDWNALPLVLVVLAIWLLVFFFRKGKIRPLLPLSSLKIFAGHTPTFRQRIALLPERLLVFCLAVFLIAALDPRIYLDRQPENRNEDSRIPSAVEGLAIYFILDQSGSMEQKAQIATSEGRATTTKLNLLKQITRDFIVGDQKSGLKGRPTDMIGLVSFARTAQVLTPLTLDHKILLEQLKKLEVMRIKDQDGTGIGYAIYKTAHLISATKYFAENLRGTGKPAYEIKDAVMILVTDGMQDPNPLDQKNRFRWMDPEQAAGFAKAQNIRLYVVNIDPEFTKPEWQANRNQMKRVAEMTGGRFYVLQGSSSISSIYKEIDDLEKSHVPVSVSNDSLDGQQQALISLYPYLIAIGMFAFMLSIILQTTWLRVIP